jgi:hypothetical protein
VDDDGGGGGGGVLLGVLSDELGRCLEAPGIGGGLPGTGRDPFTLFTAGVARRLTILDAGRTRAFSDTLLGNIGGGAPVGRCGAAFAGGGGGARPRGLGGGTEGFPDPPSIVVGRLGGSTEFVLGRGGTLRDIVDVGRSATISVTLLKHKYLPCRFLLLWIVILGCHP